MKPPKRTPEASEDLAELLSHPGLAPLLVEVEALVQDIEQRVLKVQLSSANVSELVHEKARAEGARKLLEGVRARIQSLKARRV